MPMLDVEAGGSLFYEEFGAGEPLVLVHGGMVDSANWSFVVPALAQRFRVITYDRRGHGRSPGPPPAPAGHVRDLGGLIEALGIAPAFVVGVSGGASVALHLLTRAPKMVRRAALHEPAILGMLADAPATKPLFDDFMGITDTVCERVEAGDLPAAAELFVERVVAPGAWRLLPPERREVLIRNVATATTERRHFDEWNLPVDHLRRVDVPVLVSHGDQTPPFFPPVAEAIVEAMPSAEGRVLNGPGHAPHLTHPEQFVTTVTDFLTR